MKEQGPEYSLEHRHKTLKPTKTKEKINPPDL